MNSVSIKTDFFTNDSKIYTEEDIKKEFIIGCEIIYNCDVKPYVDIDKEYDLKYIKEGVENIFVYNHYKLIDNILYTQIKSYLIFDASRYIKKHGIKKFKISFHIIILDLMLHCGICTMIYIFNIFRNNDIKIDISVYKSRNSKQLFRLPYTNKPKCKFVKEIEDSKLRLINKEKSEREKKIIIYSNVTKNYIDYYITINNRKIKTIKYCEDYMFEYYVYNNNNIDNYSITKSEKIIFNNYLKEKIKKYEFKIENNIVKFIFDNKL